MIFFSSLYGYNWICSSTIIILSQTFSSILVLVKSYNTSQTEDYILSCINYNGFMFVIPFFFYFFEKLKRQGQFYIWQAKSEAKFWKKIVNTLPVGIMIYQQRNVIYLNKYLSQLLECQKGGSSQEFRARMQEIRGAEHQAMLIEDSFCQMNTSKQSELLEQKYVHVDLQGNELPLAISIFQFKKAGDEYSIVVVQDQKVIEELQQERVKREYQKNFLAMITHELRNPLNGIMGIFEIILSNEQIVGDSLWRYCEVGMNSSKLMMRLINDILDMSQLEAGKFQLMVGSGDFSDIARECLSLMRLQFEKKEVKLDEEFSEIPTNIYNDKRRYSQILLNLLSNSLKFTPQGGSVRVGLEYLPHNCQIHTWVQDSGVGMTKESLNKLFSMFSTTRSSTNPEGIGLGLHICQKLCVQMGGEITVESEEGKGTKISFTIANQKEKINLNLEEQKNEAEIKEKIAIPLHSSDFPTVLVIDDDFSTSFLLQAIFKAHSIQIDSSGNSEEGVSKACQALEKGCPFHLIFIDMHLPQTSGIEVIKILRECYIKKNKNLPVFIGISGDSSEELAIECQKAGFEKLLLKPFSRTQIIDLIKFIQSSILFLKSVK